MWFRNVGDRLRPRVGAAGHVLLLPGLGVAGEQDAGRALGQEDSHRGVVGLGEELARWRCYDVGSNAAREERSAICQIARACQRPLAAHISAIIAI
jgi:hypothetical protein